MQLGLGAGDAAFFLGGRPQDFQAVAAKARDEIGREKGLTDEDRFEFAWIVDFPMYERDEGDRHARLLAQPVFGCRRGHGSAGEPGPAGDPRLAV